MPLLKRVMIFLLFSASPAVQATAQKTFSQIRPLIFQIKTSSSSNLGKTSYGTGFVVDKKGLLITNYHVVADAIWEEENNKVFLEIGGEALPLQIRAVDFVRDLAVVAVNHQFDSQIPLADQMPAQGDEIFSMGLPADVDWTIISGVYNGTVRQGPYELIHMSTPLNPGMSGGPTVNSRNQLVAVNVSGLRSMQQISFGIPVKFVRQILQQVKDGPLTSQDQLERLRSQLLDLQSHMTEIVLAGFKRLKTVEQMALPDFGKTVRCWGRSANDDKQPRYSGQGETCSLEQSVTLSNGQFSGTFDSRFVVLKNKSLSWMSWFQLLGLGWNPWAEIVPTFNQEAKLNYNQAHCYRERVTNTAKELRTVNLCLQQMNPLTNLYDGYLQVVDLSRKDYVVAGSFTLAGFTMENIKKITQTLINHSFAGDRP